MKPYLDAIRALLEAAGLTTYHLDVPDTPELPYVLVWSSGGMLPDEVPISGSSDVADQVGVTSVASSADNVLLVRARVRAALGGFPPEVAGRVTWLTLADSQPTAIDRDVTPHVAYGVDLFRLISTPA